MSFNLTELKVKISKLLEFEIALSMPITDNKSPERVIHGYYFELSFEKFVSTPPRDIQFLFMMFASSKDALQRAPSNGQFIYCKQ